MSIFGRVSGRFLWYNFGVGAADAIDHQQSTPRIYFVTDKSLACPGENFMKELCREVAENICERLVV